MSYPSYLGLVIIASLVAVFYLRLKCLYILFIDAFIQNTALPFLYTSFGASRGLIASLLVSKEIILVILFVWCLYVWQEEVRRPWPKPVVILFLFTCYCTVRIGFAFAGGDDPTQCFRKLRLATLPLLFLTVAITTAYTQPEFARKFLRQMTYLLVALSLIGILMWILPPSDFWVSHANMTAYGVDIRGDEPYEYEADTGIRHTAVGREAFLSIAPFRAFGTFGDPLAMGFALSTPLLLLIFAYTHKKWVTCVLLVILAAGLFATFDRSVWIFVFVAGLFIMFRKRKYKWLLIVALVPVVALLSVPPLAEFAKYETEDLSWNHTGSSTHAEGIVWLYKSGFTDPKNFIGSGMGEDPDVNHESGYGWLLEHFGLVAYFLWMWFLVAMYRHLKLRDSSQWQIPLLSEAMIVGMFVVMHFSYYPFSFIGWIPIWYILGLSVASAKVPVTTYGRSLGPSRKEVRTLLPESGNV
jgi:hypothetical protein